MNEGIQKSEKDSPYSVVIGIDWADQKNGLLDVFNGTCEV